jgi:hypothetical protein
LFGANVALVTAAVVRERLRTMTLCESRLKRAWLLSCFAKTGQVNLWVMRLSWDQHLDAARTFESASLETVGVSLALMGMAMLILLQDLEGTASAHPDEAQW